MGSEMCIRDRMVKWRKAHVSAQATKREGVMQRAIEKAEAAKSRASKAQKVADEASRAKARYRSYVKMRQNTEKLDAKEVAK